MSWTEQDALIRCDELDSRLIRRNPDTMYQPHSDLNTMRPVLMRRRRRFTTLASLLVFFWIIFSIFNGGPNPFSRRHATNPRDQVKYTHDISEMVIQQAKFWRSIFQVILNNDPSLYAKPEIVVPSNLRIVYQDDHYHHRPDIMWMNPPDIERMQFFHDKFISDVEKEDIRLVYNKGTRGIITTVSDTSFPVLLVSLRMLRSTGSKLPVEVFLWTTSAYTEHLCSTTLPRLNAKCLFLTDIFKQANTGVDLRSYQYKIFAILFSSFDEILFLDSDAWAAMNPDYLFTTNPFIDTGMVVWPDFWYASESPYFFQIAGVTNVPELHERAATEAGILMYSKERHGPSILLATYYNYFGPEYYYPLQSQGGPGQGDKETFGLAALVLNETFYAVSAPVTALGRRDSSGEWLGSAMVQYDPHIDFDMRRAKLLAELREEDEENDDDDDDEEGADRSPKTYDEEIRLNHGHDNEEMEIRPKDSSDDDDHHNDKAVKQPPKQIQLEEEEEEEKEIKVEKAELKIKFKRSDDHFILSHGVNFDATKVAALTIDETNSGNNNERKTKNQHGAETEKQIEKLKNKRKKKNQNNRKKKKKKLTPLPPEELLEYEHSPPSVVQAAESFSTNSSHSSHYLPHPNSPEEYLTHQPQPLFIHTNYPKFNPRTIFTETMNGAHTPTRDTNGTRTRCWDLSPVVAQDRFGYDIEWKLWGIVWKVACEDLIGLVGTGKGDDDKRVCDDVQAYIGEVYGGLMSVPP